MNKNQSPLKIGPIPLVLLVVGVIYICGSLVQGLGAYIQLAGLKLVGLKIEQPKTFKFASYDLLLKKYVHDGLVDYGALKTSPELAKATLDLSQTDSTKLADKLDQLAYWINAYNLLTIKNIVDHYPISNLKDLDRTTGLKKFIVGGKPYTLDEIEELHIKPLLLQTDWRGIFLICNGARSTAPLASHAYEAESITTDMDTASKEFVTDEKNYLHSSHIHMFSVSPFFRHYQKIIETQYPSTFELVNAQFSDDKKLDLSEINCNYALPYDSHINDSKLEPSAGAAK